MTIPLQTPLFEVDFGAHKTGPRRANDRAHGTEGMTSMQDKITAPAHRADSMAALAAAGLGHLFPGPFGADATARGLCLCGCGRAPRVATKTDRAVNHVKGQRVAVIYAHRNRIPLPDRFRVASNGCWVWLGANIGGYAITKDRKRNIRVYRWLWEEVNGPIPDGLVIDHLCRNPPCVNPAHLEPVTYAENTRRGKVAKITWDEVHEIRRLAGSVSQSQLGARFGISQSMVSLIVLRKEWVVDEPQLDLTDLAA